MVDTLEKPIKEGGCVLKTIARNIRNHYKNKSECHKRLPNRLIGTEFISLTKYSERIVDTLPFGGSDFQKYKITFYQKICETLRGIGTLINRIHVALLIQGS